MKIILLLALFILVGLGSSGSYQLGSHSVNLNLSIPTNYTVEAPIYQSDVDSWVYILNITPNIGGYLRVLVSELSFSGSNSIVQSYADICIRDAKATGIGGYHYSMTSYRGRSAFEDSYPAQTVYKNGYFIGTVPESYSMASSLDDRTGIQFTSKGTGEAFYREVLDSINITKNITDIIQQGTKSFLGPTSAYAGPGKGAKPGMENQNAITVLGDSQSSNITATSHGVE